MKKLICSGIVGWDITPQMVRDFLREANGEDVEFEFSSPGGYIAPGLEIFNAIRNYPGKTTARLVGYAMSMASYIPLACDYILAEDNAVYMIHNARGGIWGDHVEILKYGNYLKGLSGISAREYAKQTAKRGKAKAIEEIVDLMDAETFFFGPEMVDHGFVDEIIATDNTDEKEVFMLAAQASFEDAMGRLAADQKAIKADLEQAATLMAAMTAPIVTPPAVGHKTEEVRQMSLKALLTANPAAQVEFDAAIATARTEGEQVGKEAMKAVITQATAVLTSDKYPAAIKTVAANALTGQASVETLTTTVSVFDAMTETASTTAAVTATQAQGEVKPDATKPVAEGEPIESEDALQALIEKEKGGN